MDNYVRIEILGTTYTVASPEDEQYVLSLAKEINDAAVALQQSDPHLSPNDILVLCALASADSCRKSEQNADNLRSQLTGYLDDATRAKQEAAALQKQLDESLREINRLRLRVDMQEKLGGQNT